MADKSSIEWTDATWNPVRGCSRVSEGCRNCYAERVAARFSGPGLPYEGLAEITPSGPRWTGEVRLIEEHLEDPLRWKRPRRIFVNSMSDLFHEGLSDEDIDRVFAVMALAPQHIFQVLTKRAERMQKYISRDIEDRLDDICHELPGALDETWHYPAEWPLPNVHLGVSVEDQKTADERIPWLLKTPAAVRWVSYEPALGQVNFDLSGLEICLSCGEDKFDAECSHPDGGTECGNCGNREWEQRLDWIVVGGESGPGARPFDIQWARDTIAQCKAASVPVFVKQLGARPWVTVTGAGLIPLRLESKKGGDINEWPEDLRVRQYPNA